MVCGGRSPCGKKYMGTTARPSHRRERQDRGGAGRRSSPRGTPRRSSPLWLPRARDRSSAGPGAGDRTDRRRSGWIGGGGGRTAVRRLPRRLATARREQQGRCRRLPGVPCAGDVRGGRGGLPPGRAAPTGLGPSLPARRGRTTGRRRLGGGRRVALARTAHARGSGARDDRRRAAAAPGRGVGAGGRRRRPRPGRPRRRELCARRVAAAAGRPAVGADGRHDRIRRARDAGGLPPHPRRPRS